MNTVQSMGIEVGNIVTTNPLSKREFEVLALDDIDGEMIYVSPVDGDGYQSAKPQWVFLTYVRKVQEQEDATE
jgi:hypothetical protein